MNNIRPPNKLIANYVDVFLDSTICNLRCEYCYVAQRQIEEQGSRRIPSINRLAQALSTKRLGGPTLFNLCAAGETMFYPDIVSLIEAIVMKGHYVSVVTNGTYEKPFSELINSGVDMKRLFFKFSFHYRELMRTGTLDSFIRNVLQIRDAGASYTVEIVGSDDNVPYIDEIKELSVEEFGAFPHVTIPRDDRTIGIDLMTSYNMDEYKAIWDSFDSDLFRFKLYILHKKQTGYCTAGYNTFHMDFVTGDVCQCICHPRIDNIYDDVDRAIIKKAVGNNCELPYCYNGHVYLTLGVIKEFAAPTYYDVRNRTTRDGSDWVTGEIKQIFLSRLYDEG